MIARLLELLALRAGCVVTHDEVMDYLYHGAEDPPYEQIINAMLWKARRVLDQVGSRVTIVCRRPRGLQFLTNGEKICLSFSLGNCKSLAAPAVSLSLSQLAYRPFHLHENTRPSPPRRDRSELAARGIQNSTS